MAPQHAFVSRDKSQCVNARFFFPSILYNLTPHWNGPQKMCSPLTLAPPEMSLLRFFTPSRFMQSLWLHYLLSRSPSIGGQWGPLLLGETEPGHHSFTRLLGAFVRWLLPEKGKQINTSPVGLTGNLYPGWNMSGTSPLDSLTVTGQLTGVLLCTETYSPTS